MKTRKIHTSRNSERRIMNLSANRIASLVFGLAMLTVSSGYAQVGNCIPGIAETSLAVNNVRARMVNTGGLFYRGTPHVYEVPRGSGLHSGFAGGLWIGGQVANTLRVAASRYGPWEFWPGPVDAVVAGTNCSVYDRVYNIAVRDIVAFEAGEDPSQDLLDWPWELGAVVIDGDGISDNYNLAGGDRPEILGEETVFWIMNDVGNVHNDSNSEPLGIEVHVTAFAAGSTDTDIDNATFYRYRIINRNNLPIADAYMGVFMDGDLGEASDDYVGSDPALDLAYTYNGDNDDEGDEGYGIAPPAVGVQILRGPLADSDGVDNDADGSTDEAGERLGMTSFLAYNNSGGITGDPSTGEHYYNHLQSKWKDGQHITVGGNGRDFSRTPTNFMFDGNPPNFWSEFDSDDLGSIIPPGDRRYVAGIGPFDLQPGEDSEVFFGVIWARGTDNLDSVAELRGVAGRLQGISPESILGNSPSPTATPALVSPGDGAASQPVDITVRWNWTGIDVEFDVQVVEGTDFSQAVSIHSGDTSLPLSDLLLSNVQYSWRVRAFTGAGYSPWSQVWTFSTTDVSFQNIQGFSDFSVVQNAAGPVVPADGASADWQGFPGSGRPLSNQQVGEGAWIIATGMSGGCPGNCGEYSSFIARSVTARNGWTYLLPFDFEIRFTAGGSLHYDRFGFVNGAIVVGDDLPFELWNIGIGTPLDSSDDYRMIIAGLDLDSDGWNLTNTDHASSGGSNDPTTDWFYWHNPADTSPGTDGYDTWAADALVSGNPGGAFLGPEVLGRMVFFNWNGGDVNTGPPYDQDMPEEGTIFRIETGAIPNPLLSSPFNGQFVASGDIPLHWTAYVGTDQLLIANDPAFTNIVSDIPGAISGELVNITTLGSYYWKVIDESGGESLVWQFDVGTPVTINQDVIFGWNLIGTHYTANDMHYQSLYPNSVVNSLSTFDGSYSIPDPAKLKPGSGYWLNFPAPETVNNTGFLFDAVTVEMGEGWNIISGPNCAITVIDDPGGIILAGTTFGYNGAYFATTTLAGGSGYWIRTSAAGSITLDCASQAGKNGASSAVNYLAGFRKLLLRDSSGGDQPVYLAGSLPDDMSGDAFTLPPAAPGQTWQAGFADGRYIAETRTATLQLDGATLPITISTGEAGPQTTISVSVLSANGTVLNVSELSDNEPLVVSEGQAAALSIEVIGGELPEDFILDQNYPNPFNPVTTISFALPEASDVRVDVYDVLGRLVNTLVQSDELKAGWHEIRFDAGDLASGVYLYRIRAGAFTKMRRMVILK